MKQFALLWVSLCLAFAPAFADGTCTVGVQSTANLQIQTIALTEGQAPNAVPNCAVMLTPLSSQTSYRIYTISQRGVVQIFNDYETSDPDESKSTGARAFFFFPRKAVPQAVIVADGTVQVTTSSGVKLSFNPGKTAAANAPAVLPTIFSRPGDPILATESPDIVPTNNGGVELQQTPASGTLILDTGFMLGEASFTDAGASSIFIDPEGNQCSVKNTEIFSYADTYDPQVSFAKDADLWAFLATRCPGLSLPAF